MWKYGLLLLLVTSVYVHAVELTCSGATQIGGTYTLPFSGQNITPPTTGNTSSSVCTSATCIALFTVNSSIIGSRYSLDQTCTPTSHVFNVGFTLTNVPAGKVYTYGSYTIYPTTVKGIGISIDFAINNNSFKIWPDVYWYRSSSSGSLQIDTRVTIIVWKTPEFITQTGNLDFTGPTFMQVVSPSSSADTIKSCPNNSVDGKLDDHTCVYFSRELKGSINLQSGTCDLVNTNRTVYLGRFSAVGEGNSQWVDASFRLECPVAYGYNSSVANSVNKYDVDDGTKTANQTQNKSVTIQVHPYTPVINAAQGIFSLDTGGAEGYGIQLAWGMPGEQTNAVNQLNPVDFSTRILARSRNSNFSNGPYALGGRALASGADGTIRMSARYVRTTGTVKPGPANGKVEIVAAYE